ncbi:MAG: M23 family metallopeptidase [Caulobacteraceae bacterium]
MRRLLALGAALAFAGVAQAAPPLTLTGKYVQSGYVIGRTTPRAEVRVDGEVETRAAADGYFVVGLDRDAKPLVRIEVRNASGATTKILPVSNTIYDVQRINGLPQDTVTPMDAALLARIKAEAARKAVGFASRADLSGFKDGFVMPVKALRQSSRFGGQRVLNGVPNKPHYGADLAAVVGTPVVAPADGVVSFAEAGLHFEGGLILIDHGQGLISQYLHLSKVAVKKGDRVTRGQLIGAVGKEGRATGPHLCWRLKWHGRNLDPMLLVNGPKPPLG